MATKRQGTARAVGEQPFAVSVDRNAEMRRVLAAIQPDSAAHALRALRDAFPDVPLDERVRMVAGRPR